MAGLGDARNSSDTSPGPLWRQKLGISPAPEVLALLLCPPGLGCVCPLSQGRAPEGTEESSHVSSEDVPDFGTSLQTQTALKAEGYPNLWALDLWEVYIKHSVIAFLWPVSWGNILGAGTAVGTLSGPAFNPSPQQQQGRDSPATDPRCPKC